MKLRRKDKLYIGALTVNGFKSFYGEHVFCFREGLNVVSGGSGAGKTNLCEAFEFILFGANSLMRSPDRDVESVYSRIVNSQVGTGEVEYWIGCRLNAVIMDEQGQYMYSRDLAPIFEDSMRENYIYPVKGPLISPNLFHECVYWNGSLSGDQSRSVDSRDNMLYDNLERLLRLNMEAGIGFIILDGVWSMFSLNMRQKAFDLLSDSELDQIILLTNEDVPFSDVSFNYIRLDETVSDITFKVDGFPFPVELLLDDLDLMVYNRYVMKGELFLKSLYGSEYTVEVTEVTPDGARYVRDISKINIQ